MILELFFCKEFPAPLVFPTNLTSPCSFGLGSLHRLHASYLVQSPWNTHGVQTNERLSILGSVYAKKQSERLMTCGF